METTALLNTLLQKKNLTTQEAQEFLNNVTQGVITPVQTAAILTALRMKGESVDEVVGLVRAMRSHMISVNAPGAVDVVGTGGDGSGTFNISTTAAFVVAGAGVKVAKHGNRAASSKCGSADVLEALGVNIQLKPQEAEAVFEKVGMVFLWAPTYHPAMKEVVAVRRELKIRTIFNLLGPFANPAATKRQLTGVPDKAAARMLAEVGKKLAFERLLIVTSEDGMDEISLSAKTTLYKVEGTRATKSTIDPRKYGFKKPPKDSLGGGSAEENAQIVRDILHGQKGPRRDVVVLNSAYALYAAGAVEKIKDGITRAEESLDSGSAEATLERLVSETRSFA